MIKKEIRRATQQKDWETVQKLQNILKTQAEIRKLEAETQQTLTNQLKLEAETDKLRYDVKFSFANIVFGSLGLLGGAMAIVKGFIFNKD